MGLENFFSGLRKKERSFSEHSSSLSRSFSGQIFSNTPWYTETHFTDTDIFPAKVEASVCVSTEKEEILTSLRDFTEVKTQAKAKEDKTVSFTGGEVKLLPETSKEGEDGEKKSYSLAPLPSGYSSQLIDLVDSKNIEVVFIGETPKDWSLENGDNDLLSKMIQAMKLEKGQFARAFFEKDTAVDKWPLLAKELSELRPKVVVSLGAMMTHLILGKKERLSRVHGKTFDIQLEDDSNQWLMSIIPVFHPDILNINPNMKRSAWIDLKKVLNFIGRSDTL
jgi:hypothetical protein